MGWRCRIGGLSPVRGRGKARRLGAAVAALAALPMLTACSSFSLFPASSTSSASPPPSASSPSTAAPALAASPASSSSVASSASPATSAPPASSSPATTSAPPGSERRFFRARNSSGPNFLLYIGCFRRASQGLARRLSQGVPRSGARRSQCAAATRFVANGSGAATAQCGGWSRRVFRRRGASHLPDPTPNFSRLKIPRAVIFARVHARNSGATPRRSCRSLPQQTKTHLAVCNVESHSPWLSTST